MAFGYEKMDRPEVLGALFHPPRRGEAPPPSGAVDLELPAAASIRLGARFFYFQAIRRFVDHTARPVRSRRPREIRGSVEGGS